MASTIQTTIPLMSRHGGILFIFIIDPLSNFSIHASVYFHGIVSLCDIFRSNILVRLCSLLTFLQLLYALCIWSTIKSYSSHSWNWNNNYHHCHYYAFWRSSTGQRNLFCSSCTSLNSFFWISSCFKTIDHLRANFLPTLTCTIEYQVYA